MKLFSSIIRSGSLLKGLILLLAFFSGTAGVFAQAAAPAAPQTQGVAYNMLLWLMVTLIVILFIFILVMAEVLKKAGYFHIQTKKDNPSGGGNVAGLIIAALLLPALSFAQEAAPAATDPAMHYGGLSPNLFWGLFLVICFEVLVVFVMIIILKKLVFIASPTEEKAAVKVEKASKTSRIWDKINDSVEIDREASITMDHDYDGIRELDNSLPPWWLYGFYMTILFSFIYLIHFHVTKTGDLSAQEYTNEVAKANAEVAAYMKTSANNVDETNVKFLDSEADLKSGRDIYQANCAACHGKLGEGMVGPNLTDDFWIHGGGIVDIFKTIKYGFAERGMKAWKDDFSPVQMAEVASFVKSLKGTNPPNPKEKQGELWTEGGSAAPSDSTVANATPADSSAAEPAKN